MQELSSRNLAGFCSRDAFALPGGVTHQASSLCVCVCVCGWAPCHACLRRSAIKHHAKATLKHADTLVKRTMAMPQLGNCTRPGKRQHNVAQLPPAFKIQRTGVELSKLKTSCSAQPLSTDGPDCTSWADNGRGSPAFLSCLGTLVMPRCERVGARLSHGRFNPYQVYRIRSLQQHSHIGPTGITDSRPTFFFNLAAHPRSDLPPVAGVPRLVGKSHNIFEPSPC